MRRKNDIFLKGAIELSFSGLLRFFFPEEEKNFDKKRKPFFLDKELPEIFPDIQKKGGLRVMDMLARVYLLNGGETWFLVHLELQDQMKPDFAERMLTYYYRVTDKFNVPVTAIAILTGKLTEEMQANRGFYTRSFLGTEISYRYNSYHILDNTGAELLAMNNPFAVVVLAAQKVLLSGKIPNKELGAQRLTLAKAFLASGQYDHREIAKFLYFLREYVHIGNKKINTNFDDQVALLTGKTNTMDMFEIVADRAREEGLKIGVKKGVNEKEYTVVKNLLLANKFTIAEISTFAGVTEAFVKKTKKTIN